MAKLEKQLNRLKQLSEANRKSRAKKRMHYEMLQEKHPEEKKLVKKVGRPALESDQPELLRVICELAKQGASADGRRRCEILNACKTLDDLHEELKNLGFQLSRTATYLRLLPRNFSTIEGKRHHTTVPVRLCKPQFNKSSSHVDSEFCKMTISHLKELSATLSTQDVAFLSVDDKSRVPIGITAANKQTPLLMHLEYSIRLPDHDFVKAAQHKLIPSVYAGLEIKKGAPCDPTRITYSGPTYIAIRSAKHDSSTAATHAFDLDVLMNLPEFSELVRRDDSNAKPVLVIISDGGPDENPRYEKVQQQAVETFKKYNLDAIFLATNAPGRSAFNAVERRMAPLSRHLAGVVLPHDHFGAHLDASGKTIDIEKEKNNFEAAANVLTEIWNDVIIDNFPVIAKYVQPGGERSSAKICQIWKKEHMRCSKYLCQIVKCNNHSCCSPKRSAIDYILKRQFLPAPVPVSEGLHFNRGGTFLPLFVSLLTQDQVKQMQPTLKELKELPYDTFLPSIEEDTLKKYICRKCSIYHSTLKSLKEHSLICGDTIDAPKIRPLRIAARRQNELMVCLTNDELEWVDETDCDDVEIPEIKYSTENVPIIQLVPTWEDIL